MSASDHGTLIGPPPIPLPTITDQEGDVICIGPTGYVLINNVATNGRAVALEWAPNIPNGGLFAKSPKSPGNWWRWTGAVNGTTIVNGWVNTGSTALPSGRALPIVSFVAQVWNGTAWEQPTSIPPQP